jgi:hypothetical protein
MKKPQLHGWGFFIVASVFNALHRKIAAFEASFMAARSDYLILQYKSLCG